MRVNPNFVQDVVSSLGLTQRQEEIALQQLSTGQRINKPSDDPAGAGVLLQVLDQSSQADSYLQSIGSVNGQLQTADSTLSSIVTVLQRAISLGVGGANGTQSDADRASLAQDISGIRDQLLSLANTSYQGRFIFSGTSLSTPFVEDDTTSSGVRYAGNDGVNQVTVGNGYEVQTNLPGSQVFSGSGADVFQSINDLITSLNANSGIDSAVESVRAAFDYVTQQRVFYGNAVNQLNNQQTYLNSEKLQLSQQQNTVAGADINKVVSNLVNSENARNATLAAMARVSQMNLFDYLR
jgi:flagellar hook-associated protein 3 FlgL